MAEPLLIAGLHKTASSTLVKMLNAHPDVFVLYETDLARPVMTKYARRLVGEIPDARRAFTHTKSLEQLYRGLAEILQKTTGRNYAYVGDKLIEWNLTRFQGFGGKLIFTLRDIRTWLAKDSIAEFYWTDVDAVPVAVDYLSHVIESHRFRNSLHIRMEDLVADERAVRERLGGYLGLDMLGGAENWWAGNGTRDQPQKRAQRWLRGHPSAKTKPSREDTAVELNGHPIWSDMLPLFDKYYNTENRIPETEISADLFEVGKLLSYPVTTRAELYEQVHSSPVARRPKDWRKAIRKGLRASKADRRDDVFRHGRT